MKRFIHLCRALGVALCVALGLTVGLGLLDVTLVRAQEVPSGASFITPFPEGDIYKLQVVGDGLAEGALSGLVEAFGSDSRLQINRKHRHFAGLARAEADDEIRALDDGLTREKAHITVVMLGRDDRVQIRLPGNQRLAVGGEQWREEYGRRADRLMKVLKRRGGSIYWIGLPVIQRAESNEAIQLINDLVRDRANLNAIKFIDAFAGFADENGSFVALGPDVAGLVRRLRESDGVSFTAAGNRKLAHFVEREIRRDLTQAKADRSIPLAGAEPEQRKINPVKVEVAAAPVVAAATPRAGETKSAWSTTTNSAPQPLAVTASSSAEQKADNSRVVLRTMTPAGREETTNIDILRPAIPASVIELIGRNASPERATQVGDTLQEILPGGLLLLSSVSPSGDGTAAGRRAKMSPTQTPFFRVMVKGEQLPPKPGRADDFRWPRPDQMVEAPVVQPAAAPAVAVPLQPQPKAATPRQPAPGRVPDPRSAPQRP
ncbi:MAG: DUF459 domain-containing protein [Hyphomicrobiaceae bacterium]